MALSEKEIQRLAAKAESLLASGLDGRLTGEEIENHVKEALLCLDTIVRNAPANARYPYAVRHAETMCRAITWRNGTLPWRWVISCDPSSVDVLSGDEAKRLAEKANGLRADEKPKEALCYFDTIIKYSPRTAYYFSKRASCRLALSDVTGAIDDYTQAIELDPHRPEYYKYRAICEQALAPSDGMSGESVAKLLAEYKTALQKDPTVADVWMALVSLTMLVDNWDEVISLCGQSQPYVTDPNDQAVRAWILCLALTLAGDPVVEEDMRPLREVRMVHGEFIGRVIDHLQQFCRDPKVQERTQKEIRGLNEILLDRMSDLELSSRI